MAVSATKTWIATQVLLLLVLAAVGAVLVIHLSGRSPLRVRVDWTFDARNTLAPETVELLRALPDEADVDVFLRPEAQPLDRILADGNGLLRELLTLAEDLAPDKLDVTFWDVWGDFENVERRMAELGVREDQIVVVSIGERRAVLRFWQDVVEVDPGSRDPRQPIPPSMRTFRGQEALCQALALVGSGESPVACVTTGHGEPDPESVEPGDAGSLVRELRGQGFEVKTWDPARDGGIPADCDVLLVLSPEQPFRAADLDAIEAWVTAGGRLFCTSGGTLFDEPGSTGDLLARFGMHTARGIVCVPYANPFTQRYEDGSSLCAEFTVPPEDMNRDQEITAPLVEGGLRIAFFMARSFARLQGTGARAVLPLLHSPAISWRDLPGDAGAPDFRLQQGSEEIGRFTLAALARITPTAGPRVDPESGAALEGRVVAVAAHNFARNHYWSTNRPFLLGALNWLVERDLEVRITASQTAREDPRIDVVRGRELPIVHNASVWALPALSLLLGVLVFFWRRRG